MRCLAIHPDSFGGSTWFAPESRKVKAKVGILYSKLTIVLVKDGRGTMLSKGVHDIQCKMMFYRADKDTSTPGYDFDFRTLR